MSRLDKNGNFSDIVGELRRVAQLNGELYSRRLMLNQAADEIERLREALKPFARIADLEETTRENGSVIVNVDRCRDARAALKAEGESRE